MKKNQTITILLPFIFIVILLMTCPSFGQESSTMQSSSFTVARMVIAQGVEDREPVGVAETFPSSAEMVYCFIEATHIEDDTMVMVVWSYGGKEVHTYDLQLQKGPRWRTFAYKNLRGQTGEWKVEIRDSSGNSVKSVTFRVE